VRNYFASEVALIFYITLGAMGLGILFGFPLTGTILGLLAYVGWSLLQIYRLDQWIAAGKKAHPPEVRGIFGYFLDESIRQKKEHKRENKKLKAALVRQKDLMEGVRDAAILVDAVGHIQWFNRQARQMFKLKPSEDTGIPLLHLIREPSFVAYLNKDKFVEPITLKHPPQTEKWIEASVTKYKNGDRIILIRDVTRLRRLENMRRDFIANLSHELRTPLTVLRGYLETLQLNPKTDEKLKRIYDQMEGQSIRMANLLKDLTTLSRLENIEQSRQPMPIEICALIDRIVKDAQGLAEYNHHKITTEFEQPFLVNAVDSELYSAFSNLVFNAVRHTPGETQIKISCARSKSGLRVVIEDDGPGIDERHLPHLTERFYRVDSSRNSDTGGTGLGLAIVKHALASQGGRLNIKSTLGVGSKFSCLFPADQLIEPETSSDTLLSNAS